MPEGGKGGNKLMRQVFLYIDKMQAALEVLSDEQAGALLRRIVSYTAGEDQPTGEPMVDAMFTLLKVDLDNAAEKYEAICEKRRQAGKLGGAPRGNKNASKNKQNNQKVEETSKNKQNNPNTNTNTNTNTTSLDKDDNNIVDVVDYAPPAQNFPDKVSKRPLSDSLSELENDRTWVEQVCIRHKISEGQLKKKLEDFKVTCEVRANDKHATERDLKQHIDSWLSINLEKERKNERNANGACTTKYRGVNQDNYREYEAAIAAGAAEGLAAIAARKN